MSGSSISTIFTPQIEPVINFADRSGLGMVYYFKGNC
jgi:hypothetical protein